MRTGLVVSSVLHAAALSWGLWHFGSPDPLEASYAEALPVEIVMSDVFEGVKGEKEAPITDKPAPTPTTRPETLPMPAENVGDNEVDLDTPPEPEVKPNEVEPQKAAKEPPAPEPPREPEETVAETEPEPAPEPAPTPEPEPAAAPEPQPDPVQEMIADAKPAEEAPPVPTRVPVPQVKPAAPQPRVAEAEQPKPQPAKPEPSKQETPKPQPAKQDSESSQFDEDQIAALLSQEKASGGGAKRSTDQASLGSRQTTGSVLSRSQLGELQGMIREQMYNCWSPPVGATAGNSLQVSIHMRLDPSGALEGVPSIVSGGGGAGAERAAAEAALRAVRRCSPYNLPTDQYQAWSEITLNFDPSEMF
ncbi:hypothetical protein [Consotaella aegiceratis]|uniref:hypothetical protein n=1 Tax=Consotaella aegiceratis TaxID=3097961 RepID=UPI002F40B335